MSQYNNNETSSYGLILCGDQLDTRLDSWLVLKSTIRRLNKAMIESFFVLWLGNWFETRAGTVVILYHTFLSPSITWDDVPLIECHFETSIYLTFSFPYPAGLQCPFLTSLIVALTGQLFTSTLQDPIRLQYVLFCFSPLLLRLSLKYLAENISRPPSCFNIIGSF